MNRNMEKQESDIRILSVGEIIWDIYPDRQVIGGAPLNFAAHAARCGANSVLLSAVGSDPLGDAAMSELETFGVNTALVKRKERPTGRCLVTLNSQAIPHYEVLGNAAYDHIRLSLQDRTYIRSLHPDALYFGTLIQRSQESGQTLREVVQDNRFGTVFCDINLREGCYDATSVRFCLEQATILKVSGEEEPALRAFGFYAPSENSPRAIAKALCVAFDNLKTVLITLGVDGSYGYEAESGQDCRQSAIGGRVASTVGAGDSFSAAFLTNCLAGQPMEVCMQRAAAVSGYVVAHTEAVPDYDVAKITGI